MQKVFIMSFDHNSLKYDAAGLIPCIAQDEQSGEVLMMAWMNAQSVAKTLETGKVTYWSRSRQAFWVKGESSGHGRGHHRSFRASGSTTAAPNH